MLESIDSFSLIRRVKVKLPMRTLSKFWETGVLFLLGTILENPRMENTSEPKEKRETFHFRPCFLALFRKILRSNLAGHVHPKGPLNVILGRIEFLKDS